MEGKPKGRARCPQRAATIQNAFKCVNCAIFVNFYRRAGDSAPYHPMFSGWRFLRCTSLDFMDGKSLKYKLNTDRTFTLYSIGDDSQDDGGNFALQREKKTF